MRFPSPCGEKVGINYAGPPELGLSGHAVVSVPLRGKGRDQPSDLKSKLEEALPVFPSPCGEKVGINPGYEEHPHYYVMFPSPCGEKVGINPTLGKA